MAMLGSNDQWQHAIARTSLLNINTRLSQQKLRKSFRSFFTSLEQRCYTIVSGLIHRNIWMLQQVLHDSFLAPRTSIV